MKPKESFDGQKFLEGMQSAGVGPMRITVQLASWLQLTTDLTQIGSDGTITYTISILGFTLKGVASGITNNSDSTAQLGGDLYLGNVYAGQINLSITSDLGNQYSTGNVTVTFGTSGSGHNGLIAAWGQPCSQA